MSTGKRLAKRSIVGTKVVVLREDGLYYPGVIQAVKTAEVDPAKGQSVSITKYAVRSVMDGGAIVQSAQQRQQLREYSEVDLIGPGFQSTAGLTLQPGQKVFVTFTGREVAGHVTKHRPDVDEVHITLASNSNSVEIVKRMEEVRLMESRKSLRLMDQHDVDFARLAEGPSAMSAASAAQDVSHPPRKRSSSGSTTGIDVPGAFVGSRKRRSSPSSNNSAGAADVVMDEDEDSDVMDECAAAMVLMRLSCSPHSPRWEELAAWQSNQSSTSSSSGAFSWRGSVSSNGDSPPHVAGQTSAVGPSSGGGRHSGVGAAGRKLKFRSATPSPPLMSGSAPANYSGSVVRFHHQQQAIVKDDGIASDESISECDEDAQPARSVIYQCTWPGCSATTRNCADIEAHVRSLHLGPRQIDEEVSDHEEEFYYTELEEEGDDETLPVSPTSSSAATDLSSGQQQEQMHLQQHPQQGYYYHASGVLSGHPGWMASSPPTLSHMDMARPPHEDPEYQRALMKAAASSAARPIAIPARVRSISWSSGFGYATNPVKQVKVAGGSPGSGSSSTKLSPNGHHQAGPVGMSTTLSVKSSPVRRPRGEAKKCRKVYGMEHREQWCTQCKWKKACTRFGE